MANLYLRVPHYVSSYFRNKDSERRLSISEPILFCVSEYIYQILCDNIYCNAGGTINPRYCFSAKQWNRMMGGYSIDTSLSTRARSRVVIPSLADELTLSDYEVHKLSGLPFPRGNHSGEYVCSKSPSEVMRNGRLVKTNTWWMLTKNGASLIRERMSVEFWRALYSYMDRFRDYCTSSGNKFVVIDGLERFMERYDIRNSDDNGERNTLKREYNRKRLSYKFTDNDYVEFG